MSGLKCQSCMKQKADLVATKSSLMPQQNLMMCKSCVQAKFEPRWIIILWGRQNGFASVSHLIAPKQRYFGAPILASDLIR